MKFESDKLYIVDFEDGKERHLVFEDGEVANLLVEKMENPRQFYADVLEKGAENVEAPKVFKLEGISDIFDLDPDIVHLWTYRFLPTEMLFFEDSEGEKE